MPGSADAPDQPDPPAPAGRRRRFPPAAIRELNALIALIEDAYAQRVLDEEGRKKLYGPYLRLKQRHGGRSAFQLDDPAFRGGARAATGDVNNDGRPDLLVAAGFLGGPRVAVFDGATVTAGGRAPARLFNDVFAFDGPDAETLLNGVFVGAGDVDWMAFTATLQVLDFDGFLVVEREQGEDRLADVAAGVKFLRRFAPPPV